MLNPVAVKIAVKIIKMAEGCNLIAYPDPSSKLSEALSRHGMLAKYKSGQIKWKDLGVNFQALSGAPWTIGYGETKGITKDMVWTQLQADKALQARTEEFMSKAIKNCSKLALLAPECIAAITSLAYNIGDDAFKTSTACKRIMSGDLVNVPEAIKRFKYDNGKIVQGLVNRRQIEADLWNSGRK